ncbi:ribosome maturation protein [Hyaloraphidium curvatum]|nr:ribosome maturation protein [Hyaloraphidium curvatum]
MTNRGEDIERVIWKPKQTEGGKEGNMPLFEVLVNRGMVEKWRKDKSIPMVEVVQLFDVFEHATGGAEGIATRPSKAVLDSVFGTSNSTDVIEFILKEGEVQPLTKASKNNPKDRAAPGMVNQSRGTGAATMPHGGGRSQVHG